MIYLASPYSHPDPLVREARYAAACRASVRLLRSGQLVFSPIVHSHPLVANGLPSEWSYWKPLAKQYLARCSSLTVLALDGWRESIGVQAERELADELHIPVAFMRPSGDRHAPDISTR